MKKEKCIILGGSGTGKDFLMRGLIKKGLKAGLKCTTRPPREHEQQGINYNFISEDEFSQLLNENKFLVYQKVIVTPEDRDPESWFYGITYQEFEDAQIFIMTPSEFKNITTEMRKNCFVVYLDIDRKIKEARITHRQDKNDSIKRRLDADEIDFKDFLDYDLRVTDPDFSADDVYDLMD